MRRDLPRVFTVLHYKWSLLSVSTPAAMKPGVKDKIHLYAGKSCNSYPDLQIYGDTLSSKLLDVVEKQGTVGTLLLKHVELKPLTAKLGPNQGTE